MTGARAAARFFHDRAVEQLSARHARRPAWMVRRPGTFPAVLVTPTPAATCSQTRARRLRARVRLRLRGYVCAWQTPRFQSRHQLLLFFCQKPIHTKEQVIIVKYIFNMFSIRT